MTARNLRCAEQAQDRRALAQPQPFPLTGDGMAMTRVRDMKRWRVLAEHHLAAAIVEARYRDWLTERGQ